MFSFILSQPLQIIHVKRVNCTSYSHWYGIHFLNCFVVLGDFGGLAWCSWILILPLTGNIWSFGKHEPQGTQLSQSSVTCVSLISCMWQALKATEVSNISALYKESDFPESPWQRNSSRNSSVTVEPCRFWTWLSCVSSGCWCSDGMTPMGMNEWCVTEHVLLKNQSIKTFIERIPLSPLPPKMGEI